MRSPTGGPIPLLARAMVCVLVVIVAGGLSVAAEPTHDSDGPPSPEVARGAKNVVLITLDTFRADRIHAYGGRQRIATPHLDAFEGAATTFLDVVTTAPMTTPAHASLFTGTYPHRNGVRDNHHVLGPEQVSLAEILANQGYATGAFVSAFTVSGKLGFRQGFDVFDDEFDEAMFRPMENPDRDSVTQAARRRGDKTVDRALQWLEKVREERFFLWLHLFDPHSPYDSSYSEKFGQVRWTYREDIAFFRSNPQTPERLENINKLYDGGILFADEQVARLLDRLDQYGLRRDALIVITADHGESLGEHHYFDHSLFLYEPSTRIPLMITDTSLPPGRSSTPAGIIDIAPTILDIIGLPVPTGLDGTSLLKVLAGEAGVRPLFMESTRCTHDPPANLCHPSGIEGKRYAVKLGGKKVIVNPGYETTEYYDLTADPGELRTLAGSGSREFLLALQELLHWRLGWYDGGTGTTLRDEETKQRLRALGYVE